ncbi:AI-2E family transporter [Flavobacterium amniphilum]|uniref:AI-2E family transporter n=1 Tax=Flavobacterium amniphilum TaxID=1834035 RepID=UPI00202A2F2A|nr:AI-2E family transporter [Flavobacterium amniphilum]MCL9806260.1 AI-2E family transporter [Flavobacterium amniphilum]
MQKNRVSIKFLNLRMKLPASNPTAQLAYNLISLIAIISILYIMKPFLVPLLISVILSVMVFPIVNFLEQKLRFNRIFSALTVLLILGFIIGTLIWLISAQISNFVGKSDLYTTKLTELYNETLTYFENNFGLNKSRLVDQNEIKFETLIRNNFSKIGDFLSSSTGILSDLFLIPIYIFFLLLYRKFFVEFIHKAFPEKNNKFLNIILDKIYDVQKSYLLGLFTVMLIVGVLNSVGLLLLGIENAIFFGFLAALLLLIPYIGIIIGSLLPALVALATKDSAWYSLGVIGIFGFVQFLEGNFITPKITGSKVSVNAFISIVSLVLFSMLWGTAGMILALPITASLKIIFDHTPNLRPYGFLIGEPSEEHLKSKAKIRLEHWEEIREQKESEETT